MENDLKTRIRRRRLELNLSMEELAKRAGVTKTTIHRWETGESTTIRSNKIAALAKALEVSPAYLMRWPENVGISYDEEFIRSWMNLTETEQEYVRRFISELITFRVPPKKEENPNKEVSSNE